MDLIFVERIEGTTCKLAAIDRDRIFRSRNPGQLATVYDCCWEKLTDEDRAQIFYAMAPLIGGLDIFADIDRSYRSPKLNTWCIGVKDEHSDNLFSALEPMNYDQKVKLYRVRHDIGPTETVTATSDSLFSLMAFAEHNRFKTGLLQRCIDVLVKPEYRGKAEVYADIDEHYRQIMRYKLETETECKFPTYNHGAEIPLARRLVSALGLKSSCDTTTVFTIPKGISDVNKWASFFVQALCGNKQITGAVKSVAEFFRVWSGAKMVECEGGYRLEVDPGMTRAISYMLPLPSKPAVLQILDTPM